MTETPLTPVQLAVRWQALCANPAFADLAGRIGLAARRIAEVVRRSPEWCIDVASASNALPKFREKAMAYVNAGAQEGGRDPW